MRILLDYRPALVRRTGVGEYAHRLAEALVGLLGPRDRLDLFSASWKHRLEPGRVPGAGSIDVRIPNALLNLLWHRLGNPPAERLAGPIDIAQSMHPLLLPARRAQQFVTVYDLHFLDHPEATRAEIRRDYVALAAAHARRAAGVVVISEYTANQVRERLGVRPDRIVCCPPGAPPWRARPRQVPDGPLLFIGSPEPRKNLPALLRAYARLLDRLPTAPDLVLAGAPAHAGSDVGRLLACEPWARRVRRLGYVEDANREDLYRQASLLLLPSLDEGFGMTAVEAMAVGVPVVASTRGALPEVTGGAALLVDPGDEAALAEAMARVLTEPQLAAEMASRGRERALGYTWLASAARLLAAYRAVCAGRPPAGAD